MLRTFGFETSTVSSRSVQVSRSLHTVQQRALVLSLQPEAPTNNNRICLCVITAVLGIKQMFTYPTVCLLVHV